MQKRANPAVIGGFVVSAVALIVIAVLLLGSGRFLTEQRTYVLYFQDSVEGLSVGAPVTQQGVRIGSVSDIQVQYLRWKGEFRIPVFIDIEPGRVKEVGVGDGSREGQHRTTGDSAPTPHAGGQKPRLGPAAQAVVRRFADGHPAATLEELGTRVAAARGGRGRGPTRCRGLRRLGLPRTKSRSTRRNARPRVSHRRGRSPGSGSARVTSSA